jgi:hypothetical protein
MLSKECLSIVGELNILLSKSPELLDENISKKLCLTVQWHHGITTATAANSVTANITLTGL